MTVLPSPELPSRPTVSFVVIAHNEEAHIEATLDSILALDGATDIEIIVVDDASTDRTADLVRHRSATTPDLRLIALRENRGRGHARHVGCGAARGLLVAFVDADIVLPPTWLLTCVDALDSAGADAVGGTAVPDGDIAYVAAHTRLIPRVAPHTTAASGGNCLFRSEVFEQVSYDPRLRDGEDVALGHDLARRGLVATTVPGLVVRHAESKSWRQSLRWLYQSGVGASRQLVRFRQPRTPDLAYATWLGSVLAAWGAARRRRRPLTALVLPAGVTALTGALHVRSKFLLEQAPAQEVVRAVALDTVLVSAYFAGRTAGLLTAVVPPLLRCGRR
jgi:GT2 family glycosyltransferase